MLVATALLTTLAGCGESLQVGQVTGQLLVKGKPAPDVFVEFIPVQGLKGPSSSGTTDSEGRFSLEYKERGRPAAPGAVVGAHIVTLTDNRIAESFDGRGIKVRFAPSYGSVIDSPLRQEVAPGDQQITVEVK